jgi:hypothetical protein
MVALDVSSWDLSTSPYAALAAPTGARARSLPAPTRQHSRWQELGRLLHAAALASAMTDPQVHAMLCAHGIESGSDGC